MEKVINLKAVKALKNPIMAICQQLDNHDKVINFYKNDIDMLMRNSIKDKQRIRHLMNAMPFLIWSNIISWLTIAGIIFALFNHSHNIGSLI